MKTFDEALLDWAKDYFNNPEIEKVDFALDYEYELIITVYRLKKRTKNTWVTLGERYFYSSEVKDLFQSFYESVTRDAENA